MNNTPRRGWTAAFHIGFDVGWPRCAEADGAPASGPAGSPAKPIRAGLEAGAPGKMTSGPVKNRFLQFEDPRRPKTAETFLQLCTSDGFLFQ
jgi:hypothetical protein